MINDKYNYSLNGIEHEIVLNDNIKIDEKPLNQIILVSNKYLLKYINDLFDYNNIEYCLTGNSLLGSYIFNGINIFNSKLEICSADINFFKIKKLENEIKTDGFDIIFNDKYIKISTIFFDKTKTSIYIYFLQNDDNVDSSFKYYNNEDKYINCGFYDIFPIKKTHFEEFEISIPNKVDKILESYGFNLNFISFTKKKNDKKKIIDEIEVNSSFNIIKEKIISIIKPFLFDS